jgi:hypothetical protein
MTSYSARILSKQVFRLVIYILLEYSIEEAYKDTILQGVGGNDGTSCHNNPSNIHLNKYKNLNGEILLERN